MPKAKKQNALENLKIDVKENYIFQLNNQLLEILLKDRTTNANLMWATSNYSDKGRGFTEKDFITIPKITGKNGNIIKPRIEKSKAIQLTRIKKNAEVFTPSWICNKQNNLVDAAWFGLANIFNKETDTGWLTVKRAIPFKTTKAWQDYVRLTRLEITCGEAPYLVSRYDTTTGEIIPIEKRIGLLDRKLRVVGENTKSEKEWVEWATIAFKNTYGYDFQGDNVLLARENLLLTFADYYFYQFSVAPITEYLLQIADILSWNIWQMDGLKFVVPNSCHEEKIENVGLFETTVTVKHCEGCEKNDSHKHNGNYCKIMDWQMEKPIKFVNLLQDKNGKIKQKNNR